MSRMPDEDVDDYSGLEDSSDVPCDLATTDEPGGAVNFSENVATQPGREAATKPVEVDEADDWTVTADAAPPAVAAAGSQSLPVAHGFPPPLPTAQGGGRLMHVLRPHGHWNQRVVLVGVVGLVAVVLFLVSGNSSDPFKAKSKNTSGQAARDLFGPGAAEEVKSLRTSENSRGLTTPELGSPGQAVNFSNGVANGMSGASGATPGVTAGVPPPMIPPVVSYAPLTSSNSSIRPATAPSDIARRDASVLGVSASGAGNSFAVRLRAGERAEERVALKGQQPAAERSTSTTPALADDPRLTLGRGSRIELVLLEPVRSGIATSVSARVVTDVRDGRGQTLVPAGSTAVIPLLPQEVNGRIVNDRAGEGFVVLADGTQLALKGTIKGADGYAGLTGRVRKVGGRNALGRVGGALARAGGRLIGSQTGVSTYEIEDAVGVNNTFTAPSARVVEIPAGTRFSFTVGW
ncbi:MAG: hypothetical protein M3430_07265 [Acidobacteriota bacterium]|nr:hypothetical protein [Acidobacteriota bacterium]